MLVQAKINLTYITIGAYFVLGGIEYAVIFPTLWLYLSTVFHAPAYMFGIVLSSFSVADLLSGLILGRISDRTHRTKLLLIITNVFQAAGSFLYIVNMGPIYLILSRVITGLGSGISAPLMGDLARTIPVTKRTSTLAIFFALRQAGLVIGPGCNIFLSKFNFYFGPYHINQFTSPGFFMMILWTIHELMSIFMFWNLSKLTVENHLQITQASDVTVAIPSFDHRAESNVFQNEFETIDNSNHTRQSHSDADFAKDSKSSVPLTEEERNADGCHGNGIHSTANNSTEVNNGDVLTLSNVNNIQIRDKVLAGSVKLKMKNDISFKASRKNLEVIKSASCAHSGDSNNFIETAELLIRMNSALEFDKDVKQVASSSNISVKHKRSKSHDDILSKLTDENNDKVFLSKNHRHHSHSCLLNHSKSSEIIYHKGNCSCDIATRSIHDRVVTGESDEVELFNNSSNCSNRWCSVNCDTGSNNRGNNNNTLAVKNLRDSILARKHFSRNSGNHLNYGSCNTESSVFQSDISDGVDNRVEVVNRSSDAGNDPSGLEWRYSLKELFKPEIIAILFAVFVSFYNQLAMEALLTPLTQKFLSWGEMENSYLYCAAGVEIILVFMLIRPLSRKVEDKWLIFTGSFLLLICIIVLAGYLPIARQDEKNLNLTVIILVIFVDLIGLPMLMLCSNSLYTKLVPSKIQGFSQGVRRVFAGAGTVLGPLWAGGTIESPFIMFIVMASVNCIVLILLMASFKHLSPPDSNARELHASDLERSSPPHSQIHCINGDPHYEEETSTEERTALIART